MAVGDSAKPFWELFDSISGGDDNCASTYRFLLDSWVRYAGVDDIEAFVSFVRRAYTLDSDGNVQSTPWGLSDEAWEEMGDG